MCCRAGFTAHPSSAVQAPGTYLGLIEKLDYLKSLGVNAIELLPVFEFNELEYYSPIPGSPTNEHRFNFWGYSTGAQQQTQNSNLRAAFKQGHGLYGGLLKRLRAAAQVHSGGFLFKICMVSGSVSVGVAVVCMLC